MANGTIYSGTYQLDFEKPLIELEKQIGELEKNSEKAGASYADEVDKLRQSHQSLLKKTYAKLSAWQTVQVARHPGRPQAIDYIRGFVKDFCELHGDRRYGDDPAIITGFGRIGPHKCLIVAHNKGRDTKEKIACHFGCAHPEGYRKALAKMKLAEKYELPIVTFIDTPGAYPGIGAEERGQAEAIALNLREMARMKTPIACVVIGEGGSGGALGIGIGDRVAMMQYAWYSVISPEGCAAILWKTGAEAAAAAEQLHLTAKDNLKLGVIDEVIDEPMGGAHRAPAEATVSVEEWIIKNLRDLKRFKIENLLKRRYEKFRAIGETAKA
ncbi:MAG: acetyl-CoA carboxylase carboxyltransferase subunit alpha [Phycisphaerales bacterium]